MTRLRLFGIAALFAACSLVPATAEATDLAQLHASFSPDRLGASTTIGFSFDLSTSEGTAPAPLTAIDLQMPAGLNYTTTTLGLANCKPTVLAAKGANGCPANSRLGFGSARVEVPFGTGAGHEIPEVQAFSAPSPKGNLRVLFYASGLTPVYAQLSFTGEVLPDSGLFGSQLATTVPPVKSVPGGPDVSVVSVESTIGPNRLTYYRYAHGRKIPFHPRGVSVPERCPRGGFPFAARFSFQDGNTAQATTTVPCPPKRH